MTHVWQPLAGGFTQPWVGLPPARSFQSFPSVGDAIQAQVFGNHGASSFSSSTVDSALLNLNSGLTTQILVGGGATVAPVWTTAQGSGAPVRATSPTLTTPTLGVATATTINKLTLTQPATGSTLTIADGQTLTVNTGGTLGTAAYTATTAYEASGAVSTHAALQTGVHGISITAGKTFSSTNTLTLGGTDGSTLAIGTGGTLGTAAYTAATAYEASGAISSHAALQTGVHGISITAGKTLSSTNTLTLAGTDGSTLNVGTGGTLGTGAYATIANYAPLVSPSFTTPALGVATATSINKMAITAPATGSTLAVADGKTLTASNTLTLTATDGSTLAIGAGGTLGSAAYTASTAYDPAGSAAAVTKSSIGLGSVENTALSTWGGTSNITTVGSIASGSWGGTTIALANGGTGKTAITALSLWASNSANALAEITPGAGNSIRVNAGGTAWEAYTPVTSSAISNLIASPTTIAADTSLIVMSYLNISSDLTVNGNIGVM